MGYGAVDVTKSIKLTWSSDIHGPTPYNLIRLTENIKQRDDFERNRNDTGRSPGRSPTAGVDLGTLPPTAIQRYGALRFFC
jgi:hypothetical protein